MILAYWIEAVSGILDSAIEIYAGVYSTSWMSYWNTPLRQFLRKLGLLITGLRNELITRLAPLSLHLSQVMNTDMIQLVRQLRIIRRISTSGTGK